MDASGLKSAISKCLAHAVEIAVDSREAEMGHVHGDGAAVAAAAVLSVSVALDGQMAQLVIDLDARYAAGVTATVPALSRALVRDGLSDALGAAAEQMVIEWEAGLGHSGHAAPAVAALTRSAVMAAIENDATVLAAVDAWMVSLDASYLAGATVAAGYLAPIVGSAQVCAGEGAIRAVAELENRAGHGEGIGGHGGVHAVAAGVAASAASLSPIDLMVTTLLTAMDARYQVHA